MVFWRLWSRKGPVGLVSIVLVGTNPAQGSDIRCLSSLVLTRACIFTCFIYRGAEALHQGFVIVWSAFMAQNDNIVAKLWLISFADLGIFHQTPGSWVPWNFVAGSGLMEAMEAAMDCYCQAYMFWRGCARAVFITHCHWVCSGYYLHSSFFATLRGK